MIVAIFMLWVQTKESVAIIILEKIKMYVVVVVDRVVKQPTQNCIRCNCSQ